MKRDWVVVPECDMDDGTPAGWSLQVGEHKYYWIDWVSDNEFEVIDSDAETVLMTCKTLTSAKRWVSRFLL